MSTNQGDLDADPGPGEGALRGGELRLPGAQKFFDGSPCHREVNQPTFGVLQCGDPTGTGSGGPTYKFAQEIPAGRPTRAAPSPWPTAGQPELDRQPVLPLLHRHPAQPGLHRRSAPSTRPGWPCWTRSRRPATTAPSRPSAGGGAPNLPVTITIDDRRRTGACRPATRALARRCGRSGAQAVTRSTSKTPSTLRTVCSRCQVRRVGQLEGEPADRHPVAAGLHRRGQDVHPLVGQRPGDVGEQPVPVERLDLDGDQEHRARRAAPTRPRPAARACAAGRAALVQSVRCTLTPPPRVTKPRMSSPGTGVQHLASLTQTSVIAVDDDARVAAGRAARRPAGSGSRSRRCPRPRPRRRRAR